MATNGRQGTAKTAIQRYYYCRLVIHPASYKRLTVKHVPHAKPISHVQTWQQTKQTEFNSLFSRIALVCCYQKGKTIVDLNEQEKILERRLPQAKSGEQA